MMTMMMQIYMHEVDGWGWKVILPDDDRVFGLGDFPKNVADFLI
jgi:hypothetical protein